LNWRTFVIRHWKAILLLTQIGIVAISIAVTKANAEPIDTPCGP
jgi:hypothetical protein